MDELISIVVPVYNGEKYLNRCIKSILEQSYQNIEVILVDDGSKDSTPELCDCLGKQDKRIKVIHKDNAGVSSARNTGLQLANGEYIAFVDSDDIILPDMFTTLLAYLKENRCDIVTTSYQKISDTCQPKSFPATDFRMFTKEQALLRALDRWQYHMFTTVWGGVLRSGIAKNIRFDENLTHSEDSKYMFDYLSVCNRIGYIDAKYYCYYQNDSGAVATSIGKSKSQLSIIQAYKYMYDNTVKLGNERLEQVAKECMKRTLVERACAVDTRDFYQIKFAVKEWIPSIILDRNISLRSKIKIFLCYFGIFK